MRMIFRAHRNDSSLDELEIIVFVDQTIRLHPADVLHIEMAERGAGEGGELFSSPILAPPGRCGEPLTA